MPSAESIAEHDIWSERVRLTLGRYDETLLRQVAARLLKPRNQWPAEELIARSVETLKNAVVIDRRLKDLPPAARDLLAAIDISGQPRWRIGQLLGVLAVLDHVEGLTPIQALLEAGLLFPELLPNVPTLRQWEDWLGTEGIANARVFAHPAVTTRSDPSLLALPELPARAIPVRSVRTSDGLEWPLRCAVAWQQIRENPIRLTQQGVLFKRDLQRLQNDALLNAPFADHLETPGDLGVLALEWAMAANLIEAGADGLSANAFPSAWESGLVSAVGALWSALLTIERWDPAQGYAPAEESTPFPSVALAAILLLARQPAEAFIRPADIADHIAARHPSWLSVLKGRAITPEKWMRAFLLGVVFPMRLLDAAPDGPGWCVRLSDLGRHLFARAPRPGVDPPFAQTLIVQPNGEIIVYRQGLSPNLIGRLSRFAAWKTLGAACTMELQADTVYRGLETGFTLREILQLLQQRGSRALPPTVLDSLQRWSNKRERITVCAAATLVEFSSPEDLETAYARGLVAGKVTDRIGLVDDGQELDYRHFRLVGNRDYEAKPQQCVLFDDDGVTFTVDAAQSDLLLEAELGRFAEAVRGPERRFVLTMASIRGALARGLTVTDLEQWSLERSGQPLSPAARLLLVGSGGLPGQYGQRLVVQLPNEPVADGIMQWPPTATLVQERLGPCTLSVRPEEFAALQQKLREIGIELNPG